MHHRFIFFYNARFYDNLQRLWRLTFLSMTLLPFSIKHITPLQSMVKVSKPTYSDSKIASTNECHCRGQQQKQIFPQIRQEYTTIVVTRMKLISPQIAIAKKCHHCNQWLKSMYPQIVPANVCHQIRQRLDRINPQTAPANECHNRSQWQK